MFLDVNLFPESKSVQAQRELVVAAFRLGYDGVAINHVVAGRSMSSDDACRIKPVEVIPAFAAAEAGRNDAGGSLQNTREQVNSASFQQLSRITVAIEDASQASALSSANPVLAGYDIIAVQPTSARTFMQACTALEVDLIVLDLQSRRSFRFRQQDVRAAVDRGLHFEIAYSGLFQDGQGRRQLLTNAQALISMTRGKNIIISSGASKATDLRSPYEVANLGMLFGLNYSSAKAAVLSRVTSVILRGETRRKAYKGAVMVQPVLREPFKQSGRVKAVGANDERLESATMEVDVAPGAITEADPHMAEPEASSGSQLKSSSLSGATDQQLKALSKDPADVDRATENEDPSARSLDEVVRREAQDVQASVPLHTENMAPADEWTIVQSRKRAAGGSASRQRRKQRNKMMKIQI